MFPPVRSLFPRDLDQCGWGRRSLSQLTQSIPHPPARPKPKKLDILVTHSERVWGYNSNSTKSTAGRADQMAADALAQVCGEIATPVRGAGFGLWRGACIIRGPMAQTQAPPGVLNARGKGCGGARRLRRVQTAGTPPAAGRAGPRLNDRRPKPPALLGLAPPPGFAGVDSSLRQRRRRSGRVGCA
jgi:hypothetical protein